MNDNEVSECVKTQLNDDNEVTIKPGPHLGIIETVT